MLDKDGYRTNVGIILCNADNKVLWARRCKRDGWQFPQGGMQQKESPEQAMYRELKEEVGLDRLDVKILGQTRDWLRYNVPEAMLHSNLNSNSKFHGQKQIWYLLRFKGIDSDIVLDRSDQPEFDAWRWIEYWRAVDHIIEFKRNVYRLALGELEPLLPK